MLNKPQRLLSIFLFVLLLTSFQFVPVLAQEEEDQPVVRAVLFYSPTCGHCENLIQNQLPPILEQYGDQLKIVAINTITPGGQELYSATIEQYEIADNRVVVPMLVVADIVLVGGGEIPSQLPGIIDEELASDGTDWPAIPGLAEVVAGVQFTSQPGGSTRTSDGAVPEMDKASLSMLDKFKRDPVANTIAVIVLVGMIISIIWVTISFTRPLAEKDFWPKLTIPILSVVGMGVAFYLTYVETSGVEAACGPVGDCNAVQLSPYAILFGVLPVGLLGLIGYVLILIGWAIYQYGPESLRWASAIAVWGMAFFGILFTIYLTFLEPFVIGATCMWCISSAIIMTIVFLAATNPAKRAWREDDFDEEDYGEDYGEDDAANKTAEIQKINPEESNYIEIADKEETEDSDRKE